MNRIARPLPRAAFGCGRMLSGCYCYVLYVPNQTIGFLFLSFNYQSPINLKSPWAPDSWWVTPKLSYVQLRNLFSWIYYSFIPLFSSIPPCTLKLGSSSSIVLVRLSPTLRHHVSCCSRGSVLVRKSVACSVVPMSSSVMVLLMIISLTYWRATLAYFRCLENPSLNDPW